MAALEGRMGSSIYESVRDAPVPDWQKLDEQSHALEEKIVEALKRAKPCSYSTSSGIGSDK